MKSLYISSVAIALIVVALLTTPKSIDHKKEVFESYKLSRSGDEFFISKAEDIVSKELKIENYRLFSISTIYHEGSNVTLSYGFFGNVFVSSSINYYLSTH